MSYCPNFFETFKRKKVLIQYRSRRSEPYPAGTYLIKVNNEHTMTMKEICLKLIIKMPECCTYSSGVFIVDFEQVSAC